MFDHYCQPQVSVCKNFLNHAQHISTADLPAQVDHVLEGYNACIFAYGQTGSGKTYTIFGEGGELRGITPRTMEYLFTAIRRPQHAAKKFAVFVSFLEEPAVKKTTTKQ